MELAFFKTEELLLSITNTGPWIPSQGFLYCVLLFGALLTAGVALSVLTFYEDHYWSDKGFREELRFSYSRKKSQTKKLSSVK